MCSLFLVSCLVFSLKSFFLSFFLPDFELCLLFNIIVFGFKNPSSKTPIFGQKGGCNATNGLFLINLCFAKCVKLSFLGFFFGKFLAVFQKNTMKIGILAHFSKQKITKKWHFLNVIIWSKLIVIILVQVGCVLKSVNLDQIITFKNFGAQFVLPKKRAETLYFYSVF